MYLCMQTGSEYLSSEASHINTPPLELLVSDYAPYCYDATWTLLYALQATLAGKPFYNYFVYTA